MIKTYWKQLEEWVINLKHNPFFRVSVKLTIVYVAIIAFVIGVHYVLIYSELTRDFNSFAVENIADPASKSRFLNRSDRAIKLALTHVDPEDVISFSIGIAASIILS